VEFFVVTVLDLPYGAWHPFSVGEVLLKTNRSVIAASLLAVCSLAAPSAVAQPLFAFYGMSAKSPAGPVRMVNVSVIRQGGVSACKRQIAMFERQLVSRGGTSIPSGCAVKLPSRMAGMLNDQPVPGAFVTKYEQNGSLIYSLWYGLPSHKPTSVCRQLVEPFRAKGNPVSCTPPQAV
jgi:hypothetical protein